jgi:hypothetical protein
MRWQGKVRYCRKLDKLPHGDSLQGVLEGVQLLGESSMNPECMRALWFRIERERCRGCRGQSQLRTAGIKLWNWAGLRSLSASGVDRQERKGLPASAYTSRSNRHGISQNSSWVSPLHLLGAPNEAGSSIVSLSLLSCSFIRCRRGHD